MPTLHPDSHYTELRVSPYTGPDPDPDPDPIDDVPGRFERIAEAGSHLALPDGGAFEDRRTWRYTWVERPRVNFARNHVQGVQRKGRHLILSGGDATESVAHLFVATMESRREQGPWGSNVLHTSRPEDDGLVRVVALDRELWHPGGIGLLGDLLAVPLYGDGVRSRVRIFHVADPAAPAEIESAALSRDVPSVGAAALTRLPDGRYLLGAWWEDGSADPPGRLDLYLSATDDFRDGFSPGPLRFPFPTVDGRKPAYQAVSFLAPEPAGDGPGAPVRLYFVGTENTSKTSPFTNGANAADLFALEVDPDAVAAGGGAVAAGGGATPVAEHLLTRELRLESEWGNLDAGGGVHVGPDGLLSIYSCYHWRINDQFRLTELHGEPPPRSPIVDIEDAWIELYEHDGFRGRRLCLFGTGDAELPDYDRLRVQGGDFAGTVSSVRYQIPEGTTYVLYGRRAFEAGPGGDEKLELEGSGLRKQIPNLSHSPYRFDDRVRSSRYA